MITQADRLDIVPGLPESWDEQAGPSLATATERWIRLGEHRLGAPLVTAVLTAPAGGHDVMMTGAVLAEPGTNPRMDPYLILSGQSTGDGLLADGPHPWRKVPAASVFPSLLLMFPNYETAPVGRRSRDPAALAAFLRGLRTCAQARDIHSISLLYLSHERPEFEAALQEAGWAVQTMTHRCDLAVTWHEFDGYLATFSSKRRVAVRRELRALSDAGVHLSEDNLQACDPQDMVALRLQLMNRYGGPADAERELRLLTQLATTFPSGAVTVVRARLGDRLLGFTLLVQSGERWTALMTASDYTHPASRLCYFATCYYLPASSAPSRGVRTIAYGMGSWEAKRLRGCQLAPVLVAFTLIDGQEIS